MIAGVYIKVLMCVGEDGAIDIDVGSCVVRRTIVEPTRGIVQPFWELGEVESSSTVLGLSLWPTFSPVAARMRG